MTDVPVSQEAAKVTVTDADKEASAELAHAIGMSCEDFTSGGADVIVQALARHRQQAERDVIARMEPMGWRPIETAPKDGTIIDLWVRPYHGIAYRACDYWWLESAGVWRTHVRRDIPSRYKVTHWLPVPTPPAGEA